MRELSACSDHDHSLRWSDVHDNNNNNDNSNDDDDGSQ